MALGLQGTLGLCAAARRGCVLVFSWTFCLPSNQRSLQCVFWGCVCFVKRAPWPFAIILLEAELGVLKVSRDRTSAGGALPRKRVRPRKQKAQYYMSLLTIFNNYAD